MNTLLEEKEEKQRIKFRSAKSLNLLKTLYPSDFRNFIFKHNFGFDKKEFLLPSLGHLKERYSNLSEELNMIYKEQIKTSSERTLAHIIKRSNKKQFFKSIWVGPYCLDLFFPNIRSDSNYPEKVMRGLALEVDGGCHDRELKMYKDNDKDNFLSEIGIGTLHISNSNVRSKETRIIIDFLTNLKTLDSRERNRLWKRIYLATLATHLSFTDFIKIFNKAK